MQRFFPKPAAAVPEPVSQSITAVQTPIPKLLAPVLQPITQSLILVTANLILGIPPTPLPELYPRIPPPNEAEYVLQDLLADMKNHLVPKGFVKTINSSRPTKVYLVCDRGTQYRN